jgi:hypothetical protein
LAASPLTLSVSPGSLGARAVPGRDLALEVPLVHGIVAPHGTALDDHLDSAARVLIDQRARERYEHWCRSRAGALTVEGVELASIGGLELVAECFVPAARIEIGLPRVLETAGARSVNLQGMSAEMAGVLRAVAARAGVAAVEVAREDGGLAQRWRPGPLFARAAAALGSPSRVRGDVVCVPYWNLTPVFRRLAGARNRGLRPVASGLVLPGLSRRATLETALRGGWLGHPGARARSRTTAQIARALNAAAGGPVDADPLELAIDAWALSYLRDHAPGLLAGALRARRILAAGSVRALLVPFDGPPAMAALVEEARRAGVPSLLVQHGYDAELGVPDKDRADVAALWSERDERIVRAASRARPVVTGNPGAERSSGPVGRAARRNRTLLLVDYPSRLSARVSERVSQRHLTVALDGLAVARPGSTAVIRPHPGSDGAETDVPRPSGLEVEVDRASPIETLLSGVDACVGAMSTATLQAAARGVPVVYLDVEDLERPWPFDGSSVPVARDSDALAELLAAAVDRVEVAGQAEMLEALGALPDATDAVCDLLAELVR